MRCAVNRTEGMFVSAGACLQRIFARRCSLRLFPYAAVWYNAAKK